MGTFVQMMVVDNKIKTYSCVFTRITRTILDFILEFGYCCSRKKCVNGRLTQGRHEYTCRKHYLIVSPSKGETFTSGVSIIADVAESIAETQPISINRIEIWDRLIGKNGKRTSLQRTNCYWHEYTSICRLAKMVAPCVRRRQQGWWARNTSLPRH